MSLHTIINTRTCMSFRENICKLKMCHAARMLTDPDLSVARIAEALGYTDPGNFRRIFKNYYGCSPHTYRSNRSS